MIDAKGQTEIYAHAKSNQRPIWPKAKLSKVFQLKLTHLFNKENTGLGESGPGSNAELDSCSEQISAKFACRC